MVNGELLLSLVNWFQEHPERHMHQSGTSEIWWKDSFEPLGPVSLNYCSKDSVQICWNSAKIVKRENVLLVLPLERNM